MQEKYEYVQRIPSYYVGSDCVQTMVPHLLGDSITIFNSDGITYHYKSGSNKFVNKYISDERRKEFPYHMFPIHNDKFRFKKYENINHLFDFNSVYVSISNGLITERFALKDGEDALIATKFVMFHENNPRFMTRDEVRELLDSRCGELYSYDGGIWNDNIFASDQELLDYYKNALIERRKFEENTSKDVNSFFYRSLDKLTIDDVPEGITMFKNVYFATTCDNEDNLDKNRHGEIDMVKCLEVIFMGPDSFKVLEYIYPMTKYTLEHLKQLEHTSFRETKEPKFPKRLNPNIDMLELRKEQERVMMLKLK